MNITVNYYKLGDTWYLDLPEWLDKPGTHEEDLERIGSYHDFLELAAAGKGNLSFEITDEPAQGFDLLELMGSAGENAGAYYLLKEFEGNPVEIELWFNQVIYHFTNHLPEKLYIRQLYQ